MNLGSWLACAVLLGVVGASRASAQIPALPQPDTTRADSAKRDSLRRLADTLSTTDRLLAGERDTRVERTPLPRCGLSSLEPTGVYRRFDRDSIDWITAEDVTDLLATVPGVFIHRADWLGGPNLPDYLGRGAGSIEYELDCVPQLSMGADSLGYDPSVIPLGFLDYIVVETSPSGMRVYLFTRSHDRQAPRTRVEVAQGDRGAAHYMGTYESRHAGGVGFSLGADYRSINDKGPQGGGNSLPVGWVQLSYARNPHFGVQGQFLSQSITRSSLLDDAQADSLLRFEGLTRTDLQLRASWRERVDGTGPGLDLIAATTHTSLDSVPNGFRYDSIGGVLDSVRSYRTATESVGQYGAIGSWREPTWSGQLALWHYTHWTALDSRLDVGWTPRSFVSASLQLASLVYREDRSGQWALGRVGVVLPLGFHVEGSLSDGRRVQSPIIQTDTAQPFRDASVVAGFRSHPFQVEVGYTSDAGWQPQSFSEFLAIAGLAPLAHTDWLTVHARYAPVGFLTFETVYQHPQHGALPDGTPPEHALSTVTLRSRFLRNFRSGIFQLKLQGQFESWSPGIGGLDTLGAPIALPGATFVRAMIELQIGPFIAFYDQVNSRDTRAGYVPGYSIQGIGKTYGFRWEFTN